MKTPSFLIVVASFVGFAFCGVERAHAATYVVNSTGDTNVCDNTTCTLRGAINAANGNSGADTITFSVTGTILLGSALPNLSDDVTISGPGANVLTVKRDPSAATQFRIFTIDSGKTVNISGVTISGGSLPFPDAGGGINGGGISNSGALTITNSSISGNNAVNSGGIDNNGVVNLTNSVVANNHANNGAGGGIANNGCAFCGRALNINNSTITGNSALRFGGGISSNAPLTINNSTIAHNSAGEDGGGIYAPLASVASSASSLNGSIVANNSAPAGPDIFGTVNSGDYNLVQNTSGASLTGTHNITGTDPMLGPLAYYGGPTETHILLTGSPAIDQGNNFSGATTDQRGVGFPRTVDGAIGNASGGDGTDIGAFERQASDIDPTLIVTTTADTSLNSTCDPANPCSLRDAITAANAVSGEDIIYFAVTGTIQLGSALPALNSDMKILGPGANALAVKRDSSALFRIFTVNSGKIVTISDLTITNGSAVNGGGIRNDHGTLTVNNCTVSGNSANNGGGIENFGENFLGSTPGTAMLTVSNCTFSDNSTAPSGTGGGIRNTGQHGGSATVTVVNTTLSGNSAQLSGGAIENNGADHGSAPLTIKNSTLSGNSAPTGGGIDNFDATLTIGSTILKAGGSGANIKGGPITSLGYNLSSDDESTLLNQSTDQNSTPPMLGPLQDNGGPTKTHELLSGSPAIDKGNNFTTSTTDQRGPGFVRTFNNLSIDNADGGDGTDIGAFEVQNTPPTITGATISRSKGAASSNSQIATVSDNEDPLSTLTVTVNSTNPSNGVTVSNIAVDNSGHVTANVVASCSASNASFTLRVTDTGGLYAEATLTVNVTANTTPPVITLKAATVFEQDMNHSYRTFTITQMVQSATDDCDGNVISSVVIEKATSDEVENSAGRGDGNTLNDIVIASDCKSVQLRAERNRKKDGRVYLVTLRVSDTSGNVSRATYKVSVPVGNRTVVDSGVHYTVLSNCQL
jgi:CSLREA domain-containing protein